MMGEYLYLHTLALTLGCVLDFIIGDPHGIPHPVVWIGRLIAYLEGRLYKICDAGLDEKDCRDENLSAGRVLCVAVILITGIVTAVVVICTYAANKYVGACIEGVLTCYILAARSLSRESMRVYEAIKESDIERARADLSMIVGRDTDNLTEDEIVRAAVETVAENTSDGVIAPFIYTAIGGPIAGMIYKSINTMDSMIGYRNDRYEYFGKAAAKTDDAVDFIPSRISALLIIASSAIMRIGSKLYSPAGAYRVWRRDRLKHNSPNSAQTESACAGALGIRLGGGAYYRGQLVRKPYIGDPTRDIQAEDIRRAGYLMFASEALAFTFYILIALRLIITL